MTREYGWYMRRLARVLSQHINRRCTPARKGAQLKFEGIRRDEGSVGLMMMMMIREFVWNRKSAADTGNANPHGGTRQPQDRNWRRNVPGESRWSLKCVGDSQAGDSRRKNAGTRSEGGKGGRGWYPDNRHGVWRTAI